MVAMVGSGTLNVLIEKVAYRPLRSAPKLAPLITAVGMSFILQNVGLLWKGDEVAAGCAAISLGGQHDLFNFLFGVAIENADVLSVAVTVPILLLHDDPVIARSRLGKAMRATAPDPGGREADGHQRRHRRSR